MIVFWFFSWGQFYKESWMPVGESTVWYFLWWIFVYYYTLGSYYNNDLLLGYVWIYHLCHNFTAKYDKPDLNLPQYLTFVMIEIIIMESLFAFYVSFFKINISMLKFTSIGPLRTLKLMCIYYGYSKFYIIIFYIHVYLTVSLCINYSYCLRVLFCFLHLNWKSISDQYIQGVDDICRGLCLFHSVAQFPPACLSNTMIAQCFSYLVSSHYIFLWIKVWEKSTCIKSESLVFSGHFSI